MRGGLNIRVTSFRTPKGRAGLFYRSNLGTAEDVIEIRPGTGLVFGLIVKDTSLDIIDANANVVQTFASVPWSDASGVWVESFRERTVIGAETFLYVLTYTAGTWSLTSWVFETGAGGEIAQPYWVYRNDVTIRPSAVTGNITVTASGPV